MEICDISKHDVFIYGRSRAELTGISDVISFCDGSVTLTCPDGDMYIEGSSLKIESFDSKSGKIVINGHIDGVVYLAEGERKGKRRQFG